MFNPIIPEKITNTSTIALPLPPPLHRHTRTTQTFIFRERLHFQGQFVCLTKKQAHCTIRCSFKLEFGQKATLGMSADPGIVLILG
jgi:hypothetical protein